MDNELFELCKEVYEKTGWIGEEMSALRDDGTVFNGETGLIGDYGFTALYTSDYLLEKLQARPVIDLHQMTGRKWLASAKWAELNEDENLFKRDVFRRADTPLKALLKLVIALHDAGELK